jgi:vacuolar iron transporter family protein
VSPPDPVSPAEAARVRASMATHQETHRAGEADWLEDAVFGTLDGVITAVALAVTVSAVLLASDHQVFLTVIAGAVAGTLSMFAGAYLSAQSRASLIRAERAREEFEVDHMPEIERAEVEEIYRKRGFSDEEVSILVKGVTSDRKRWVDMMMRDELGLDPEAPPRPLRHAWLIGVSYFLGGAIPALPFLSNSRASLSFAGHPVPETLLASLALGGIIMGTVGGLEAGICAQSRTKEALQVVAIGFATAITVFLVTTLLTPA